MNTKKLLIWMVTLMTVLSLVLSGCAQAATPTEAVEPPVAAATDTVTATDSATASATTAPAAEPITLNYWSMWNADEPQGKVMQKAVDAFQAANPGVTIKVTWSGRDVRKLFQPAMEAGQEIDLVDNATDRINNAWSKYVIPVDTYLSQPAIGVEGKTVADTIFPIVLNQYHSQDGKTLSVPYDPYLVLWFGNKADFEAAGIASAPQAWQDFINANAKLKAAGKEPITTDVDAYMDILIGDYAERAMGCEKFVAAIKDKTGESWRDPAFVQLANDYAALASSGYIAKNTAGNNYPAGQQQVALGEASMYYNGTYFPGEVAGTAPADFKWISFSMPSVANGTGSIQDLDMGSQGMAITNKSKHPDQAFEFIKYVISLDIQKAFAEVGVATAHVDVPWTGPIADGYDIIKNAKATFTWACGGWDAGDAFSAVVLPTFTDLFVGKVTATAFIDRMVKDSAAFYAK